MKKSLWFLLAAWMGLAPRLSYGGWMAPLEVEELAARADLVLEGKVLNKTCRRDPAGRIYTRFEFEVGEAWKGKPASNPFPIVQAGGTIGAESVRVTGQAELEIGEELVLFLVRNGRGEGVVVGLSQGKFKVAQDASGEKVAFNIFHGRPVSQGHTGAVRGPTALPLLTLRELRARVLSQAK